MTEDSQNVAQQLQEQMTNSAKNFYGNALALARVQLESSRTDLENLLEQIPEGQEEAVSQIQELVDSYDSIIGALDEAAETQGVEDTVSRAVEQAQEAAEGATEQAQGNVGEVAEQTGELAERARQAAQGVNYIMTLRVESLHEAGALGRILTTMGEAGGMVGAVDTVRMHEDRIVRDITVNVRHLEHSQKIANAVEDLEGVEIINMVLERFEEEVEEEEVEEEEGQEPHATEAARQKAEELGVNLSEIEGTGADGRIIAKDVVSPGRPPGDPIGPDAD